MATYTITVNERTKEGRGLVRYLKTLGVIEIPNARGKAQYAIHLRNIWKQSNEAKNNPFQPIQERHKIGKTQEFARGRTQ